MNYFSLYNQVFQCVYLYICVGQLFNHKQTQFDYYFEFITFNLLKNKDQVFFHYQILGPYYKILHKVNNNLKYY